ncbi:unnamed protein product [Thlaspi arvense]|uniref:F-box/LRR-repeat protein 15-like leucin rich repeat domain-containing protein n=1 Tax=Thlaspi arvense TaxID=13288 RepID=A0AAU9SW28_THLAR|nr:unnamed protein product [Thlaspi arvense]
MSSSDSPGGSPENPATFPATDSDDEEEVPAFNFASGSGENPAIIPETVSGDDTVARLIENWGWLISETDSDDDEVDGLKMLCDAAEMIRKQDEARAREEEEWLTRLKAESAERQREYTKSVAKTFAFKLHSEQNPKIVQKQGEEDEEDEEEKGQGKSRFKEAKKAIARRRRDSVSGATTPSCGIDLNLTAHRTSPTLMELSMRVLAKNSDAIKSLNLVPDHLKSKLSNMVGDLGQVNTRFMQLLIQDSPSEISVRNCVDLEEKDLAQILCDCDRVSLQELNLNLCGRCVNEISITEFLKRSPNGFPSLTTLSLQGAFSLTDNGLALISRAAPLLRVVNLSYCSYLTFHAVRILADHFGPTLRGLNIGGCLGIKPSEVFESSLIKFEKLSSLSVAGLEGIHDVVVRFFTSRGSNLTDLSLASCDNLNDGTMWTVGRCCPNLEALDISELDHLTDASLKEIADGCRYLNSVNFTKTRFSDDAVAAFLEVCGGSLNQLCLNNVRDVGQETAISLAKNCQSLRYLDLSWCRKLTEEELRRILSWCSLLRSLRLFGWTQVRDEFLRELSRSQVHIVGLKLTSIFAHLDDSYSSVDAKFF